MLPSYVTVNHVCVFVPARSTKNASFSDKKNEICDVKVRVRHFPIVWLLANVAVQTARKILEATLL